MDEHQFSLFDHKESRKGKVPISKERVQQAAEQLKNRDAVGLVNSLRNLNDDLERFYRKLKTGK